MSVPRIVRSTYKCNAGSTESPTDLHSMCVCVCVGGGGASPVGYTGSHLQLCVFAT